MEMYYLAFCTPDDANDEFILTENCYNVHEGPNNIAFNPDTSDYEVTSWTSYHEFSPITPRLMLVLRSFLLPNKEEDTNEHIRNWRKEYYEMNARMHLNLATANSILEDLPVHRARKSYSRLSAEGIQLLPNENVSRRSYHQFTFRFSRSARPTFTKSIRLCLRVHTSHFRLRLARKHRSQHHCGITLNCPLTAATRSSGVKTIPTCDWHICRS
jgi:hypothetical protein